MDNANKELAAAQAATPADPARVQAANDKITSLNQELAQHNSDITRIQTEITGMTNDNAAKTQENTTLTNRNNSIAIDLITLDGQIASKQADINSFKTTDYNPKKQAYDAKQALTNTALNVLEASRKRYQDLNAEVATKTQQVQANVNKINADADIILNKSNE